MRLLILLAFNVCLSSVTVNAEDSIKPGMSLQKVVATLENHGYDVGTKYQLQIVPGNKNIDLEFCRIDDELTLVLDYVVGTKKVISMSIYATPENRTSRQQNVVRKVAKMEFDDDGFYTLKLRRKLETGKSAK